jgi:hypothetical protein
MHVGISVASAQHYGYNTFLALRIYVMCGNIHLAYTKLLP